MKKNIFGIILLLIGIILITVGIFLPTITSFDHGNNPPETEENPNNKRLKKQQCLENICIKDLVITKQVGIYSISATLENNRETEVIDTAINLIFTQKDGSTIKKTQYIQKLEPTKSTILEIQFTKENVELMKATSYKIEYATESEKEEIKSNIVD